MKKTALIDRIARWVEASPDSKVILIHPDDLDELMSWNKADMKRIREIKNGSRKVKVMTERCNVFHVVTGAPK